MDKKQLRLLMIEDSEKDVALVVEELREAGYDPVWQRVETDDALRAALHKDHWNIIISDYNMPHFDPFTALKAVKELVPDTPFIIVSGVIGEDTAVKAMKAGAHDYIMKHNLRRLAPAVERELEEAKIRLEHRQAEVARVKAEQDLQQGFRRESLKRHILEMVSQNLDLDMILSHTAESVGQFFEADRCIVLRYEKETDNEVLIKLSGQYRHSYEIPLILEVDVPVRMIHAVAESQPTGSYTPRVVDISNSESLLEQIKNYTDKHNLSFEKVLSVIKNFIEKYQIRSFMRQEIYYRGITYGVILLYQCQDVRKWTPEEAELLQDISTTIGVALYQEELYRHEQEARTRAELAIEEAEQANKRKSQFLSNISHEFRTPLNAIIGFSQMMDQELIGKLNEKQKKYANNILISGQHLLEMVNRLLDVSKIEAGYFTLSPTKIQLKPFLEELNAFVVEQATHKNIRLKFDLEEGLTSITADKSRLRQIFVNLLSNAIKFNRPGGTVSVRICKSENGQGILGEVQDTGIGIPEAKIPEIFSEFYQVDSTSTRKEEGTGLGLAIVKRLVQLHGGSVSVESEEGIGSTFTIFLPFKMPSKTKIVQNCPDFEAARP